MRHVRDRREPARGPPETQPHAGRRPEGDPDSRPLPSGARGGALGAAAGDAYVKGFLRTYADYLGLDGNLYVEEYNSRFARPDEPQLVPERFARTGRRLGGIGFLRPLVAVGVIVAIVAVAAWQLSGSPAPKQSTPPPTTTTTPTTTGSTTPKKKTHKKHVAVALPSGAALVASRGDSWLWVRAGSASGPTVYEGTLLQGKTLPVSLKNGPVWIDVGDPPSLDVRLGGKLVHGLPAQTGTILLTRRGIRPA